jgi:hypothetical protein
MRAGELFVAIAASASTATRSSPTRCDAARAGRGDGARPRAEAGTAGPAPVVIEVPDTTRALHGWARECGARAAPGRRHHRIGGQDDDEGSRGGVPRGAYRRFRNRAT